MGRNAWTDYVGQCATELWKDFEGTKLEFMRSLPKSFDIRHGTHVGKDYSLALVDGCRLDREKAKTLPEVEMEYFQCLFLTDEGAKDQDGNRLLSLNMIYSWGDDPEWWSKN